MSHDLTPTGRPRLHRINKSEWRTSDGRWEIRLFVRRKDKRRQWMIHSVNRTESAWLNTQGLTGVLFDSRRAAAEALQAHLAVAEDLPGAELQAETERCLRALLPLRLSDNGWECGGGVGLSLRKDGFGRAWQIEGLTLAAKYLLAESGVHWQRFSRRSDALWAAATMVARNSELREQVIR